MPTICGTPIKARAMRLVKVDACGVPVTGAGAQLVTKGFISVAHASEYEEGTEYLVTNADGEPCVNQRDPAFLKRVGLTMNWCQINPDAISIVTGERLLSGGSPVTGSGAAFSSALLTARFSLELWSPVSGKGACDPSGVQRFFYWAFPNVGNARIGNFTIEKASLTLPLTADTDAASSQWGNGPGATSWLPTGAVLEDDEHWAFNITTTPPPAVPADCAAFAL